jgi:methionine-rich copper-binding protein CopC
MGCQSAVFPVFNERSVGNYTVEWEVIRTSGTTTGTDSFTINENDTTTYVIEY